LAENPLTLAKRGIAVFAVLGYAALFCVAALQAIPTDKLRIQSPN